MSAGGTTRWPVELRLKRAEKLLEIAFDDGSQFPPPGRVSAGREPVGRGAGTRSGTEDIGRTAAPMSGSSELEPVGNYAVRINFDDLHDTGIYSWNYLYQLGVEHEKRWRDYLDALAANGLSREP